MSTIMRTTGRRLALGLIIAAAGVCAASAQDFGGGAGPRDGAERDFRVGPLPPQLPSWKKAYTEHVGRLIGTKLSPFPKGYVGGDMGVSFPVGDRIFFTNGDLAPLPWVPTFYDALAATDTLRLHDDKLPQLRFFTRQAPFLAPPSVAYGCNEGPFEGMQLFETTYLFYSTDWNGPCPQGSGHGSLALVHAVGGDFSHLATDWKVPVTHFQMVSVVREGDTLWIFASGAYRKSSIYLAKASLFVPTPGPFLDPRTWQYYDGHGGFTATEATAQPIVTDTCVGELSVRRHPELGTWLMTSANCADRGVVLRTASSPLGPWSDPYPNNAGVIWDLNTPGPHDDIGYTSFMHANNRVVGSDDGLSDYGQEPVWGGEYGPQMITQYFTHDGPGVYSLYYTLSSWNPYVYHLMRTVMVVDGYPVPVPPQKGVGLPPPVLVNPDFSNGTFGWNPTGGPIIINNGKATIPANSSISQEFTVDATTHQLTFSVSGDAGGVDISSQWHVSAELIDVRTGEVVRRTWPVTVPLDQNGNPLPPVAGMQLAKWNLDPLHGEKLRLVVRNGENAGTITAWGFAF